MSGIRVDVEWLDRYAGEVRAAGEELVSAEGALEPAELEPAAFGELGGDAARSYQRLCALLRDQTRRAGEALSSAGDELGEVVAHHSGGDDDTAADLARKQEW